MSTRQTPHETQVNGRGLKLMQHHHPLETWVRTVLAREANAVDATVYPSSVYLTFDGMFETIYPPEGYAIRKVSYSGELVHVRVDTAENAGRMHG